MSRNKGEKCLIRFFSLPCASTLSRVIHGFPRLPRHEEIWTEERTEGGKVMQRLAFAFDDLI